MEFQSSLKCTHTKSTSNVVLCYLFDQFLCSESGPWAAAGISDVSGLCKAFPDLLWGSRVFLILIYSVHLFG